MTQRGFDGRRDSAFYQRRKAEQNARLLLDIQHLQRHFGSPELRFPNLAGQERHLALQQTELQPEFLSAEVPRISFAPPPATAMGVAPWVICPANSATPAASWVLV